MLENKGFDLWSEDYEQDVYSSNNQNQYPFAGYLDTLNYIYNIIRAKDKAKILDIGIGTGILTCKLYGQNYEVTGIDFSLKMLEIASGKMPNAKLINWDFSRGIPNEILMEKYDFIISTYALHHLQDNEKITLIEKLVSLLNPGGKLLIGDISFETRNNLNNCKLESGDGWDDEEYYFVVDEIMKILQRNYIFEYIKTSFCAGVIIISSN